ncbi:MAG: hypothetical protein LBM93_07570, partial [Oscillospiraceae bacterium]|nr:hypothetical protein [Oscillospiraceae bacterium]
DKQLETIKEKMQLLVVTVQRYKQDEESIRREKEAIGDAMTKALSVEKAAIDDANAKAEEILAEARERAEILSAEAKEEAKRVVASARANYENIIDDTKNEAEVAKQTLTNLRQEVSSFKKNMFAIYKEHIDIISQLPTVEKESTSEEFIQTIVSENTEQFTHQTLKTNEEFQPEVTSEITTTEQEEMPIEEPTVDNILEEFTDENVEVQTVDNEQAEQESQSLEISEETEPKVFFEEVNLLSVDDVLDSLDTDADLVK